MDRSKQSSIGSAYFLCPLTWMCLFIVPASASAGSKPFQFYKERDNLQYLCLDKEIGRYARMEQIGNIHLSVKDLDYGTGDARGLGVLYEDTDIHNNTNLYDAFVDSIERHNDDALVNLNIDGEHNAQWRKCTSEMQESNFEDVHRCRAQADAFVEAKYGNAIGQFYCNIQLKGNAYPVLVYSRCSVTANNEMRYDNRFELTDINAFEPSTIEQGLIRMLDEHVRNLSEIFVLAPQCD